MEVCMLFGVLSLYVVLHEGQAQHLPRLRMLPDEGYKNEVSACVEIGNSLLKMPRSRIICILVLLHCLPLMHSLH